MFHSYWLLEDMQLFAEAAGHARMETATVPWHAFRASLHEAAKCLQAEDLKTISSDLSTSCLCAVQIHCTLTCAVSSLIR